MAVKCCRGHIGYRQGVEFTLGRALERAGRCLYQVIPVTGLVINYADISDGSLKECILCGCIGIATVNGSYVKSLAVRVTHHLI